MICFRNVCFSKRKINNQSWVSLFFKAKVTISIGRETNTHILPKKIVEQLFAKVSSSYNHNHNKNPNRSNKQTSNQHNHNYNNHNQVMLRAKLPNLITRGKSTKKMQTSKKKGEHDRPQSSHHATGFKHFVVFKVEIEVDS